ncbi:hypothetical protein ADL22_12730 [Streptomyces sp. NRRL F-4489]|uniref:hypothetical protein n=1 Tax=Streptomyces sp. NRRL F-4489 TaxID=1609095 RepID=UPI000748A03C|nr:hypothetical protein [Streptomyces sp. NRRL F-4489]KUL44802.1 hypothetical protein ADL22_12730 [Streptomyces sp. NRRL F-4489]
MSNPLQDRFDRMRPDTPDYHRLVDVAEITTRFDKLGSTRAELFKRIPERLIMGFSEEHVDRATRDMKLEAPDPTELVKELSNSFCEGFMLGLLYTKEGGHQDGGEVFQEFLDHKNLVDRRVEMQQWAEEGQDRIFSEWGKHIDVPTIAFVAAAKGTQFLREAKLLGITHQTLRFALQAIYMDGLLRGCLFQELVQELGGHRSPSE